MNVLVLNSGSSSLKFQIIGTDPDRIKEYRDERLCRGEVERTGGEAIVTFQAGKNAKHKFTASLRDISAALEYLVRYIASDQSGVPEIRSTADIHAVGHRVVHGGEQFAESVLIDDKVLQGIEDCIDLAPLHNPNNIKGIVAARELFGRDTPQVAVFDTSFHHSIPDMAFLYAIPYHFYRRYRIRRYGFHGTSHRYVAFRYRALRGLTREQTNIITLHLGNGCSAAAIRQGSSVDTSMGLTPLEGLVMGTRSGDLDPAIVGLIACKEGMSPPEVETLFFTPVGIDFRVRAFQICWAENARRAVSRTGQEDHVEIVFLDEAVEMYVDERQAGTRSPMTEQPALDVLGPQRFGEKRIVQQINHPQTEIIAGPPVGIRFT